MQRRDSQQSAPAAPGYIYIIEGVFDDEGDLIKVGYTSHLNKRLADLKTSLPFELAVRAVMLGSRDEERAIHDLLAAHRHKREWFRCAQDVEDFVDEFADWAMAVHMRDAPSDTIDEDYWAGACNTPVSEFLKYYREATLPDAT